MNNKMKIVVIGGTGLIGTKLVNNLRQRGHEVVAASPGLKPASMSDDPTQALPPRGRSLRILVVEDHGDTLRVLARLLDHFGHEISLADGAQSALEIVESKEFDVVLSDIRLPDGSGYEVIAQAKQKQPVKGVALTGFDKEEDIRRSKEAGFDFYLTKPVDFHELRTVLAQVGS
jgi:CheY-like chemotaxis protein